MLIGVRKQFIFVANTKTASTSLEQLLAKHAEIMRGGGPERKHIPLSQVPSEYFFLFRPKRPFESYFRFGVMREPISWIRSWYRYRTGNKVASPLPKGMSFEDFWRARDWNIQRWNGKPYLQSDMFCDGNDEVLADMIIPYERMGDLIPQVLDALNIPGEIPRLNVSAVAEREEALPDSLLQEMNAHYAADNALYAKLDAINATGLEKLKDLAAQRREAQTKVAAQK
jgi:hypothetical protein